MSIDFRFKDFAYPISILRLRSFLEKSQWFEKEKLEEYQLQRLRKILTYAYNNVPYYNELFNKVKFNPQEFKRFEDLEKIPILTKKNLKDNFNFLVAKNFKKFKPILYTTSGTTGEPIKFYLDKYSQVLEFCYYLRYWSWAGYRLGVPFAEFSFHHFLNTDIKNIFSFSFLTKRLVLNPTQLSYKNLEEYIRVIKKYRCLFLKGSPSSIYAFSVLLEKKNYKELSFKAIFTTGELLLNYQREKIEKVFNCKILDSYGHMERTVAISQCPFGSYHINSEYGFLEIKKQENLSTEEKIVGEVIGTSFYNFAMPLIRYLVGDLIEIKVKPFSCKCKRTLPTVEKILGRAQDMLITTDGRLITNIFIIFEFLEGILWAQLIQEDINNFRLRLLKDDSFKEETNAFILEKLKKVLGENSKLNLEFVKEEEIRGFREKYRPVISKLNLKDFFKTE
ncbi:MAG: hypothetical protein QXZ20_02955 [Candidatus Aenigmatarchaeota archaeon]